MKSDQLADLSPTFWLRQVLRLRQRLVLIGQLTLQLWVVDLSSYNRPTNRKTKASRETSTRILLGLSFFSFQPSLLAGLTIVNLNYRRPRVRG